MNWTVLLTLYGGPAVDEPNAVLQYLGANATHVLIGSAEEVSVKYNLYEGEVPALMDQQRPAPMSYYVFSDTAPDELVVANRGKTLFNYFSGALANMEPNRVVLRHMLDLNRPAPDRAPQQTNYTQHIHSQVMSRLHGKFSMVIAELGVQPSFIFRGQKLPFRGWLVCYAGMYYMLLSNQETLATRLEDHILTGIKSHQETYYHQHLELPDEATLVLRPVYLITKFRQRYRSYEDKSSRKLLICSYIRRYTQRQCFVPSPSEELHESPSQD